MDSRAHIGASIVIKGELFAEEDVVLAGRVEGTVRIQGNVLTIVAGGQVSADVSARTIVVAGLVTGSLNAEERIDVQASAEINGQLSTPRLRVAEGALLNGRVEMPIVSKASLALAS